MKIKNVIFAILISAISISAHATRLDDMYADMDSKVMTSNLNVFKLYSPDAVIISSNGKISTVEQQKEIAQQAIRAGIKIEVYQSKILGSRSIKTSLTTTTTGLIVFSEEYMKGRIPNPEKTNEYKYVEMTKIVTRVIDVTKPLWEIISEQESLAPKA